MKKKLNKNGQVKFNKTGFVDMYMYLRTVISMYVYVYNFQNTKYDIKKIQKRNSEHLQSSFERVRRSYVYIYMKFRTWNVSNRENSKNSSSQQGTDIRNSHKKTFGSVGKKRISEVGEQCTENNFVAFKTICAIRILGLR